MRVSNSHVHRLQTSICPSPEITRVCLTQEFMLSLITLASFTLCPEKHLINLFCTQPTFFMPSSPVSLGSYAFLQFHWATRDTKLSGSLSDSDKKRMCQPFMCPHSRWACLSLIFLPSYTETFYPSSIYM